MNQDFHTTANIIRLNPYLKGMGIEKKNNNTFKIFKTSDNKVDKWN